MFSYLRYINWRCGIYGTPNEFKFINEIVVKFSSFVCHIAFLCSNRRTNHTTPGEQRSYMCRHIPHFVNNIFNLLSVFYRGSAYTAYWETPDRFQNILVGPEMVIDHIPNVVYRAILSALTNQGSLTWMILLVRRIWTKSDAEIKRCPHQCHYLQADLQKQNRVHYQALRASIPITPQTSIINHYPYHPWHLPTRHPISFRASIPGTPQASIIHDIYLLFSWVAIIHDIGIHAAPALK